MSVISNFPAMPNRIAIACEYLSSLGVEGGAKDEVIRNLSPLGSDEGGEATGGTTIASAVIAEMENLALVEIKQEGSIRLSGELLPKKSERSDWQTYLRPILRERLTDPTWAPRCKQEDVSDALAWLLAQDSFNPIAKTRHHADLLRSQLSEGDPLLITIGNDARFQNMLYWARYIGFAEWVSHGGIDLVIPDPTRSIVEFLPAIFEKKKSLAIGEFASRLAKICSLFEGGVTREGFEQRSTMVAREKRHFSRSTSLCLVRLENRGMITLHEESDAETWILDLGREQIRKTSIEYPSRGNK